MSRLALLSLPPNSSHYILINIMTGSRSPESECTMHFQPRTILNLCKLTVLASMFFPYSKTYQLDKGVFGFILVISRKRCVQGRIDIVLDQAAS